MSNKALEREHQGERSARIEIENCSKNIFGHHTRACVSPSHLLLGRSCRKQNRRREVGETWCEKSGIINEQNEKINNVVCKLTLVTLGRHICKFVLSRLKQINLNENKVEKFSLICLKFKLKNEVRHGQLCGSRADSKGSSM